MGRSRASKKAMRSQATQLSIEAMMAICATGKDDLGLTARDIARLAGVHESLISRAKAGRCVLSLVTMARLAKAVDLRLVDLMLACSLGARTARPDGETT